MSQFNHIALVLEGGGFRGMFTAGVLEVLLQQTLYFKDVIGVSAGAAYGVSYVSRQVGRNLAVNRFVNHPQYCGWRHFFKNGSYFNWEFVYRTLPMGLLPFDYEGFARSSSKMKVVVSNVRTGMPEYYPIEGSDTENFRDWLTATSSLPLISRPKSINGDMWLDGGLSDSIPVRHMLANGSERAVVVLTRNAQYRKKPMKHAGWLRLLYRKYPKVVDLMVGRAHQYNNTLDWLEQAEQSGQVFVIRPREPLVVSRLDNNPLHLEVLYHQAMAQMQEELPRLMQWLNTVPVA